MRRTSTTRNIWSSCANSPLGLSGRSVYDQYVIKIDCGWNIPLNHVGTFHTDVGSCWRSCKRGKNLAAVYIWQYDGSDQTYQMKPALSRSTAINASRGGERIVAHTAITRALGFTKIRPSLYIFFNPSPLPFPVRVLLQSFFNTVTRHFFSPRFFPLASVTRLGIRYQRLKFALLGSLPRLTTNSTGRWVLFRLHHFEFWGPWISQTISPLISIIVFSRKFIHWQICQ